MTLTRQQRARRIAAGFERINEQVLIPAEIGKLESDGTYTVFQDSSRHIIYARLTADDNKLVIAYNLTVKAKAKGAIWLRHTIDGYEVHGLRAKLSTELYGAAAPGMNVPDIPGELMNTIIAPRNYGPGLVRLASENSLIVQVEPFWYRYYGSYRRWAGGTVNLSAYLPATTNYWQWAIVAIWPYDDSIRVITGAEAASFTSLTDTTLSDLTASLEGLIPCDALRLQEGLTSLRTEYFQHGRLNAAETGLSGFPDSITSVYYHIPANRKVDWPQSMTLNGGTLTLEGTVIIR